MAAGMEDFFAGVETREHAWPAGRRDLHWHVLFPVDQVKRLLTDPYAELASMPGLVPVQPQWLHMTVLHSAPERDTTADEQVRITELVRQRSAELGPFDVEFARPAVGSVALECTGRPGAPLRRLWDLTWQSTRDVVGTRFPLIPANPYPHVSIAYAGADAAATDRTAMKVWLADHGPAEPVVHLRAERLAFVSQWHTHAEIMWDVLADVHLEGEPR